MKLRIRKLRRDVAKRSSQAMRNQKNNANYIKKQRSFARQQPHPCGEAFA